MIFKKQFLIIFRNITIFFLHFSYMSKQIFSLLDFPEPDKEYGKYIGNSPDEAASKVFSSIIDNFDVGNSENEKRYLLFAIKNKETNKVHEFLGAKIELYKPLRINNILYKYRNLIIPKPDCVEFNVVK